MFKFAIDRGGTFTDGMFCVSTFVACLSDCVRRLSVCGIARWKFHSVKASLC
jgi:hypothetical protein